jgi:hypothetical protein
MTTNSLCGYTTKLELILSKILEKEKICRASLLRRGFGGQVGTAKQAGKKKRGSRQRRTGWGKEFL